MFASICRGNSDTVRVLLTAGAQVDLQNMVRYSICVLQYNIFMAANVADR